MHNDFPQTPWFAQRQTTGSVTWGFVATLIGFDLGFVFRVLGFDMV